MNLRDGAAGDRKTAKSRGLVYSGTLDRLRKSAITPKFLEIKKKTYSVFIVQALYLSNYSSYSAL